MLTTHDILEYEVGSLNKTEMFLYAIFPMIFKRKFNRKIKRYIDFKKYREVTYVNEIGELRIELVKDN